MHTTGRIHPHDRLTTLQQTPLEHHMAAAGSGRAGNQSSQCSEEGRATVLRELDGSFVYSHLHTRLCSSWVAHHHLSQPICASSFQSLLDKPVESSFIARGSELSVTLISSVAVLQYHPVTTVSSVPSPLVTGPRRVSPLFECLQPPRGCPSYVRRTSLRVPSVVRDVVRSPLGPLKLLRRMTRAP
jgi:hypothetical protein